jgi:hypothetical protein
LYFLAFFFWLSPLKIVHAKTDPTYLRELQQRARELGLSHSRTWRALLHYQKSILGGVRSSADGPGFFFSGPKGATQPEDELQATLAAFAHDSLPPTSDEEGSQHPQCKFPARFAWLSEQLRIDPTRLPTVPCPLFARWRQAISPEQVALVFSTAYINSPASMYGHTFLRLTRHTGEGNKLIDYIVNYAADVDTENGFVYAVKGLFGGFKGRFYVMPYYMKIQEYSHLESRDLWEYPLSLTSSQAERLVQHTWETRSTWFNYYFATENCSYFILELLEVADPTLRLAAGFHGTVVPIETLRAVLQVPGLVTGRTVRPSLRAELLTRKSQLTRPEIHAAEALAKQGKEAQGLIASWNAYQRARTIDTAYALLRFREGMKKETSQDFKTKERDLLILRGRTGIPPQDPGTRPTTDAPETSHRSMRVGVGVGAMRDTGNSFEDLTFRLSLQDFLDPPRGLLDDAALEMAQIRLRFENQTHRFFPERVDLVNLLSASAWDDWIPKTAWKVRASGSIARSFGCHGYTCAYGGVDTGAGIALRLGRPFLVYFLTDAEFSAGPAFHGDFRVGMGGLAGAILRLGYLSQTEIQSRYVYYFFGDTRRGLVMQIGQAINFGRYAQVRATVETVGHYREGRLEWMMYF